MDPNTLRSTKMQSVTQLWTMDIAEEDRISKLSDELIVYILSFLPTEETIPTGVLSRRWKNMWKKVQNFSFSDQINHNGFEENVTSALISYENPVFSSLTISVSYQCDPMDLVIWFEIAFAKKVSKLVFRLNQATEAVNFSASLLRKNNELRVLKLMGNINLNLTFCSPFLGYLKELHLYNVWFENEDSVVRLLHGCPLLQDLVVDIFISSGVHIFIICSTSLRSLTLATYNCVDEYFVIRTPHLKYLNIRNLDGVETLVMHNAPNLEEVTFSRHTEILDENILQSISSTKSLSLSAPLKTPACICFFALNSLEIDTKPDGWCNLLLYMLRRSPRIKCLKLVGGCFTRWTTTWVEPQAVAHCLLTDLHTILWEDYVWEGEDDKEVAIYLLKNAEILRKATFTTLKPNTHIRLQQRQEILTQITNTQRASPLCQLVLKDSSYWMCENSKEQDPDIGDFTF